MMLSPKSRMRLLISLLLAMVIAASVIGLVALDHLGTNARSVYEDSFIPAREVSGLESDWNRYFLSIHKYVQLAPDARRELLLEDIGELENQIQFKIGGLRNLNLAETPDKRDALISNISTSWDGLRAGARMVISMHDLGQSDDAFSYLVSNLEKPFDVGLAALDLLSRTDTVGLHFAYANNFDQGWVMFALTIISIIALILTIAAGIWLSRGFVDKPTATRNMEEFRNAMQMIFNSHRQLTAILTIDGGVLFVNDAALNMVGRTRSDLVGLKFWDCPWWTHSESAQRQIREECERVAKGESVRHETTHFDKDGKLLFVDFSLSPVMGPDGSVLYLVPEGIDITQSKQVEATLSDWQSSVENASVGVLCVQSDGGVVFANAFGRDALAWDGAAEHISIFAVTGLCHEAQWSGIWAKLKSKGQIQLEGARSGSDGQIAWYDVNLNSFQDHTDTLALVFITDITARKLLQQREEAHNKQTRALFEQTEAVMYLIDPDTGGIADANDAACRFYGYSRDAIRKLKISDINALGQKVYRLLDMIKEDRHGYFTTQHKFSSGMVRDVDVYFNAIDLWQPLILVIVFDVSGRNQAEVMLKESESRFRRIVEASPIGMRFYSLSVDEQLLLTGANPAADRILGVDHSRLIGLPVEQTFPGIPITDLATVFGSVAEKGEQWSGELVRSQDGRVQGVYAVLAFQVFPGQIVVSVTDVSDRRWAENALRESESIFRAVINQSHEAIAIMDMDGRIVEWNSASEKLFQLSRDRAIGSVYWDVMARDSASPNSEEWRQSQDRAKWVVETVRVTGQLPPSVAKPLVLDIYLPDGGVRSVEQSLLPIQLSSRTLIASVSRDVTDRQKEDLALRERETRFRRLVESAAEAILVCDSLVIVDANSAFTTCFGYSVIDAIGHQLTEFISQDSLDALLGGDRVDGMIVRRDGGLLAVEIRESTQPFGDGGEPHRSIIIRTKTK